MKKNRLDHSAAKRKVAAKRSFRTLPPTSETQIKKLKDKLTETQLDRHEKEVQLKVALGRVEQLGETIKRVETDNIKAKSTVMKLKEELKSKNRVGHSKKPQKSSRAMEK